MMGVSMKVKEGSPRKGSDIQKIVDSYMFLEDGSGNIFYLIQEDWFLDYLEEFAEILGNHYESFRIMMACPTDVRRKKFIMALALAKKEEEGRAIPLKVNRLLEELSKKYDQMDINMFLTEIENDEEFREIESGKFLGGF